MLLSVRCSLPHVFLITKADQIVGQLLDGVGCGAGYDAFGVVADQEGLNGFDDDDALLALFRSRHCQPLTSLIVFALLLHGSVCEQRRGRATNPHLHPVKTPIFSLDGYVPRARDVEARALDLLGLGRIFEGCDDGFEFVRAGLRVVTSASVDMKLLTPPLPVQEKLRR